MTFEMVKLLALRLQNSDEFKSDESVKKMKFTNRWWSLYRGTALNTAEDLVTGPTIRSLK